MIRSRSHHLQISMCRSRSEAWWRGIKRQTDRPAGERDKQHEVGTVSCPHACLEMWTAGFETSMKVILLYNEVLPKLFVGEWRTAAMSLLRSDVPAGGGMCDDHDNPFFAHSTTIINSSTFFFIVVVIQSTARFAIECWRAILRVYMGSAYWETWNEIKYGKGRYSEHLLAYIRY